jgi:hypothetical protein
MKKAILKLILVLMFSAASRLMLPSLLMFTALKMADTLTTQVAAVDEELPIVLLRMNFGDTGSYGPGNALIVWEAFKIYGGQIHAVEAFMRVMPASAGSGWD